MNALYLRRLTQRKDYRSQRMSKIRFQVDYWMNEYEAAHTGLHRDICMRMIQRNLKQYEWYGRK